MKRHVIEQHQNRYADYSKLCGAAKNDYFKEFEDARPLAAMLQNDRGAAAGAKAVLVFNIKIDIVKVIISQLLSDYDPNDDELDTDSTTMGSAEEIFSLVADGDSQHYKASWSSRLQFDMIVSYISVGILFRQCSRLLQLSKKKSGLG